MSLFVQQLTEIFKLGRNCKIHSFLCLPSSRMLIKISCIGRQYKVNTTRERERERESIMQNDQQFDFNQISKKSCRISKIGGKVEETWRKISVGVCVVVWIITHWPADIVLHPGITQDDPAGRRPPHPMGRRSRIIHSDPICGKVPDSYCPFVLYSLSLSLSLSCVYMCMYSITGVLWLDTYGDQIAIPYLVI